MIQEQVFMALPRDFDAAQTVSLLDCLFPLFHEILGLSLAGSSVLCFPISAEFGWRKAPQTSLAFTI